MENKKSKQGFTMAELMVVLGIAAVLMAVVFLAVANHLRNLTKLEYDNYAQSLFVAAQNHLTIAEHEGYLGRTDFGTEDPAEPGVYYYVVENGNPLTLKKLNEALSEFGYNYRIISKNRSINGVQRNYWMVVSLKGN